jgi:oligopeptidase B
VTLAVTLLLLTACSEHSPLSPGQLSTTMQEHMQTPPPVAEKDPTVFKDHGTTRTDEYYWMNRREDPRVIAYLEAENKYSETLMAGLVPLQEELFTEIKGRIQEKDASVPQLDNGYWYNYRYAEGHEYPVHCRRKDQPDAPEEILLDINELASEYDYYHAGGLTVSPDNRWLAYAEDTLSRRIYTIRFRDLQSGEILQEQIPGTDGSIVWANDNKTVFYGTKDETLRVFQIKKHRLGTDPTTDPVVYHESDATYDLGIGKTKSRKYLLIAANQTVSQEYRYLDADNPDGEWTVFQPRERNLEYSVDHAGDTWYVRTNLDARNFRLMTASTGNTGSDHWQELVPHRDAVFLDGADFFRDRLVLSERMDGLQRLRIVNLSDGTDHYVDFGEAVYVAYPSNNPGYETDKVRISYQSMTTPATVMDYDMKAKSIHILKEQHVLGGFDKSNYVSERVFATARDGAQVPISIVYRKGFQKDGSRPLLLYAYGSYGYSIDPGFQAARLSLLDRGFAYAIAHIRGGQEMGRHWYDDGKLLKKKNTFSDFIDCADHLVRQRYTSQERLFAMGGSAGGLLMGAVVNMRPALFRGVIAAVPFVDVVTTMLDESIPLTTFEWDEWGDPRQKEYFDYMLSYSPYDNVEAKAYPAILVTTGLHDSQVQYWEPAKWVARLRALKTDGNPLLLHTNMDAGHGGQSGRFRAFRETAMEYAFLLDLAGQLPVKD